VDLILGRLRRGDDLVAGIEALARQHGLTRAIVRCGPGSLDAGCVQAGGAPIEIPGPGAELLALYGEVGPDGASLHGVVADPDARVYAGRFVRGRNPVCITVELALEPMG
jgi:predicted DNA-binding protein with PD1-like motif